MRKPIIAVTGDYDPQSHQYYIKEEYIQAISLAGGLPVVLYPSIEVPKEWSGDRQAWIEQYPLDERILEMADGILFTGGDDVDPAFYGSEVLCVNGEIIPQRDAFEIKLAREAMGWKIPSLGLCRGIQLMAVSAGAKLCQDIFEKQTDWQHTQKAPTWYATHSVQTEPGSRLRRVLGETVHVNSFHHQAVEAQCVGPFTVTARAGDGIIEGIELPNHPYFVGLQWHPERMMHDPVQRALFEDFIEAARGNR